MSEPAPAPVRFVLGPVNSKNRARQWPRPLSKANSRLRTLLFSLDLFHILKWNSYV